MYGYAPQLGQQQGYNVGQPYYEQQSQTYNYGPSAETWIPPPPKYEPPPPNSEHATKAGTGNGPNTMSNEGPSSYEQQQQQQGSTTGAYAPPAGPPPSVSQHQQGNDNRV